MYIQSYAAHTTTEAIIALAARDLISNDEWGWPEYDLLTQPWRSIIGPVHPGDVDR